MISYFTLTKTKNIERIKINNETPFLRVKSLALSPNETKLIESCFVDLSLKYRLYNNDISNTKQSENTETLFDGFKEALVTHSIIAENNNFNHTIIQLNDYSCGEIEFVFENKSEKDFSLTIGYEELDLLPFDNSETEFSNHFNTQGNTRILFSSPFGTGKTTFLKEFFEKKQDQYAVFHLFPVNYSISQNEDILRYIKVELLLRLLEMEIEFDAEKFPKLLTFPFYVKEHFVEIFLPFLELIPKVGDNISKGMKGLINLEDKYFNYHNDLEIDDEKTSKSFIKASFEKEGSLFEDNLITQIIRQSIEQLELKNRKTVLIIDDLDRIDPDHVFRILNVFAATFDRHQYSGELNNKFGFHKIIIVCHYENIKGLFHHKFGKNTDFSGYIDKYYSNSIFFFDSKSVVLKLLKKTFPDYPNNDISYFISILEILILNSNITIREIIKILQKNSMKEFQSTETPTFTFLKFLNNIIDLDTIEEKIKSSKEPIIKSSLGIAFNYDYLSKLALVDLACEKNAYYNDDSILNYTYIDMEVEMKIRSLYRSRYPKEVKVKKNGEQIEYKFQYNDFINLLELIIKQFRSYQRGQNL
jgi:hypothetical protein